MTFDGLTGKKILIISPQPFSGLYVSKQHYAIELAKRDNKIFFLEPPLDEKQSPAIVLEQSLLYPSITLIKYKLFFNLNLRFHLRSLFDLLMKYQIKKILREIVDDIDIVWCFETNLFSNFSLFNAKIKIYHVVDPVASKYQVLAAKSADIIFCVSTRILQSFAQLNVPKFFVNHGIADVYLKAGQDLLLESNSHTNEVITKVGYVGNLLRGPVNYQVIRRLVMDHPSIDFHFWGASEIKNDTSSNASAFVQFLKGMTNVHLHGIKSPEQLAGVLGEMDVFLLAYVYIEGESDKSNSHKILEYLSTGKVIVSSFVETYQNDDPLICMTDETGDDELPQLFDKVIGRLDYYNSSALRKRRIGLAMENAYGSQIDKIETLLKSL